MVNDLNKSVFAFLFLTVAATFQPAFANNSTVDFPKPELVPVIKSVFFIVKIMGYANLKLK